MTNKETELFHFPEVMVHPENLDAWRLEIANLREQEGKELQTLRRINRVYPVAMANKEYEHAAYFRLEEALVWRHLFMKERDQEIPNEDEKSKAVDRMQKAVSKAYKIIRRHDLDHVRSEIHRFRGSVENSKGNYNNALMEYQLALLWLDASRDVVENPARRYEYEGYIAEHKIRTGLDDAVNIVARSGIVKGELAWKGLLESEEGKSLREKDYYTWAVWTSGVAIHTTQALIDTGLARLYKGSLERWIDQAEELLIVPEGETWTEAKYEIRKNEIEVIRRELSRLN